MKICRLTAWLCVLATAVVFSASSALAADYPPTVQGGGDVAVEGGMVGNDGGGVPPAVQGGGVPPAVQGGGVPPAVQGGGVPPAVQGGGDIAVEGVRVGNVSGGGVEGGLASTGGSLTLLWVGLVLLLAGAVLMIAVRHRKSASH